MYHSEHLLNAFEVVLNFPSTSKKKKVKWQFAERWKSSNALLLISGRQTVPFFKKSNFIMHILLMQPYKVRNFLLFCAEIQSFIIPPTQKAAGEWKFATLLLTKNFFPPQVLVIFSKHLSFKTPLNDPICKWVELWPWGRGVFTTL